jgi:hypothetical protein
MARKGSRQSTSPECMIHAQPVLPAAELGNTGVRFADTRFGLLASMRE